MVTALALAGCHWRPSAESQFSQARLQFEQGYLDTALQAAERGYRDTEKDDSVWTWRFRLLRAEALIRLGRASDALALLQLKAPPGLPSDIAVRQRVLSAYSLCQLNRFNDADAELDQAEKNIPDHDHALLPEVVFVRGRCAWSQNRTDVAQQRLRDAQRLAAGNNSFVLLNATGSLGVLLMQAGRYDEAIEQFKRILPSLAHSPLLEERALGNLGYCYSQLGDWKQVISFSEQARKGAVEVNDQRDQEAWLLDLGKAHFALFELQEAENDYVQALKLSQQLGDSDQTARCLHNLDQLALRKKDLAGAEDYWRRGAALKVGVERLVPLALDHAEITAAREQWSEAENLFKTVAATASVNPILLSKDQRELGEVYWTENKIALADRAFHASIETTEAALAKIKEAEHRMSFLDTDRFYDSYVRFLVAQHRPLEALEITERNRAQTQDAPARRLQQVSSQLRTIRGTLKRQNQIVLAYWVTDVESFLWVITASKFQVFNLPGHRDLHRMIEAYNKEIQQRETEDSPAARRLYEALIQPAEGLIPKGSHVVVVPSKVLSWVSFDALIVPGQHPHYWIEDVDVQVAGSLASIPGLDSALRVNGKPGKELLILGAPVQVTPEYPTLKNAPEEMRRVESHASRDTQTIISGKEATPQAYSAAGPGGYRLIHLDTHGTASDLSPLDSAIILSRGADNAYKLYAREIKNIPLHADLVTISACYGAGIRWYNSEGVVGLGWAFLRAGAHQVIAGLWEVDDASSPQLMDDFYGELTHGKSAAESLRDAKLKMLHSNTFYRHPYYWASLQLYTGS
jgi:CHAT domain-containing protein/Tfp pilus assembly protein PilF